MHIAFAADIHGRFGGIKWPEADILVLAGDILKNFSHNKLTDAILQLDYLEESFDPYLAMLRKQYKHILYIPGNHDRCFEFHLKESKNKLPNATVIVDESIEIDGIRFYGSPWTPWFFGQHWCFNLPEHPSRYKQKANLIWGMIPDNVDVLITHGPPRGILDEANRGVRVGCPYLLDRIMEIKPLIHAFGHIHEAYGIVEQNEVTFINASIVTGNYQPTNLVHVVEIL